MLMLNRLSAPTAGLAIARATSSPVLSDASASRSFLAGASPCFSIRSVSTNASYRSRSFFSSPFSASYGFALSSETMFFIRVSLRICRSGNDPVLVRSAGIWAVANHLPFTCMKKSSPGLTPGSRLVKSTPQAPSAGFTASAGARADVWAASVRARPASSSFFIEGSPRESRSLLHRRNHLRDPAHARVACIQVIVLVHDPVAGLDELTRPDAHSVADRTEYRAIPVQ